MKAFDLNSHSLDAGVYVLEASAGTGKTYTIEGLVLRLIVERNVPVDKILVVTFTEAATAELRYRIRNRLAAAERALTDGDDESEALTGTVLKNAGIDAAAAARRLRVALLLFDQARIATIHGFCRRTLREFAFECAYLFDAEVLTDATAMVESVVNDYWRRSFIANANPLYPALILSQTDVRKRYGETVSLLLRNPRAEWVGETTAASAETLLAQADTLHARLRAALLDNEQTIAQKLLGADWGNKGYYPEDLESLLNTLQAACERNDVNVLAVTWEMLAQSNLEAGTSKRKKAGTPQDAFFELCEQWKQILPAVRQADLRRFAAFAGERLSREKERDNVRDFNDLLGDLWSAVHKEGSEALVRAIRNNYAAALIDEFQDTDMRQWEIFRRLFAEPINGENSAVPLFLIGDPKQAIYGFRGGDIFTYLNAKKNAAQERTLGVNYRSDPRLVSAVNALFSKQADVFRLKGLSFYPVAANGDESAGDFVSAESAPLTIRTFDYERDLTASICTLLANDCAGLLNSGAKLRGTDGSMRPLHPGDICVLTRSNGEGEQACAALRERGIPAIFRGSMSIFDSAEARDLRVLMSALVSRNQGLSRAAVASQLFFAEGGASLFFDAERFEAEYEYLSELGVFWERKGFMGLFAKVLHEKQLRARILRLPRGERKLTNFLQLAQVLQEEASANNLSPEGLLRWFEGKILDPESSRSQTVYEQRLESDAHAVQVLTMHKSKGLEFPVCFCAFHSGDLKKDKRKKDFARWHGDDGQAYCRIGSEPTEAEALRAENEDLGEAVRLLYVSLTRAKHRCFLYYGNNPHAETGLSSLDCLCGTAFVQALSSGYFAFPDGSMTWTALNEVTADGSMYASGTHTPEQVTVKVFAGTIPEARRVTSFSSLSRGQAEADDREDEPSGNPEETATEDSPDALGALPRGTLFGEFVHNLFEILPDHGFAFAPALDETEKRVGRLPMDTDALALLCSNALSATLDDGSNRFTLRSVPGACWQREWSFYFPLRPLCPSALAQVFARFGKHSPTGIVSAMERLQFNSTEGFVTGFIDLMFERDGRFYIVDWKTNRIGPNAGSYTQAAVLGQMNEHNYFLQYHLYAVALHRHLKQRLPGYDYRKHFGGVFYLFVRGLSEGSRNGVFYDCPDIRLIEALEALLIPE